MPRRARPLIGGVVYHVLNRANGKARLFHKHADYHAFEQLLLDAKKKHPLAVLSFCLMPNHWHLVLRPREAHHLSEFMRWLTVTHALRWHSHYESGGTGHVYQGRFKSFPVQEDEHFLTVCRYVEGNALRAGMVQRAEDWRWSSLWLRERGTAEARTLLDEWPVERPRHWRKLANELPEQLRRELSECAQRGRPLGEGDWRTKMIATLGLLHTMRGRGRPRKHGGARNEVATGGPSRQT